MIVVTGTKRSGTSMWMQILAAGGVDVIGEAFPDDWEETLRDANPRGFYESRLRWGITPYGLKKAALDAPPAEGALKIFVPGLIRTDTAHLGRVIASVRHWREYVASITRLREMQREAKPKRRSRPEPDPIWEWWLENFALVRDVVQRDYPVRFRTFEEVLADPGQVLPSILEWAGVRDIRPAVEVVARGAQTQQRAELHRDHPFAHRFDALYEVVRTRQPFSRTFIDALNETQTKMCALHRDEQLPHPVSLELIPT